jgi:4-hydroxy-2-oxoheptanedioate aldolase
MTARPPAPTHALRQRFGEGRGLVGSICSAASADVAEVMARAGFDWLLLDLQHGLMARETLVHMIRALEITGTPSLVRVPWNRPELVGWALDAGAQGVLAPMINNADDARQLVAASRYAPTGLRSWGPARPLMTVPGYDPEAGNQALVCALIETGEAMDQLDAILAVAGIDLIVVGQSDLAISHGLSPAAGRSAPAHRERLVRIVEACGRRGVPLVVNCSSLAEARGLKSLGVEHLAVNSDMGLLRLAAAQAMQDVSALLAGADDKSL